MELCKNIFRRLTAALTLLLAGYVFFCLTTDMYSCYLSQSANHLPYLLLAAAFALSCALLLFAGRCRRFSVPKALWMTRILFGIMVFIQLVLIAVLFRHCLPWADSLSVISEAVSMSASPSPAVSSAGNYFEMYGNNYFFTIVLCYFFKFFRLFGLTAYWMEGLLLNTLAMDLGVFFCILTVQKLWGPRRSVLMAALCLTNPLLYVFIPFVYTNTISIPFIMGIFCAALLLEREERPGCQRVYVLLEAFLIVIGFQIRVTTLIPVIALAIRWFLSYPSGQRTAAAEGTNLSGSLSPGKKNHSGTGGLTVLFVLTCLLLFLGCRALVNSHVPEELREKNFPATHWMMMGLQRDGSYFSPDEDFTYSFPQKEDKVQANLDEIRSRLHTLSDLGPSGILNFLSGKIVTAWTTETDGLFLETGRMQAYSPLQKYLYGFKNDLFLYYYQFYKVTIYGFLLLCLIRECLSGQMTPAYPYSLTLLGYFLFYLLWESNGRYTIYLTLLLGMLAFCGMDQLLEAGEKELPLHLGSSPFQSQSRRILLRRTAGIFLGAGILIPCIYAMYRQFPVYTQNPISKTDYSVITLGRSYHENSVEGLIRDGRILTQTFTAGHPFNEVGLYCAYSGEEEWSEEIKEEKPYRFRLLDSLGNVLAEEVFGAEDDGKYFKLFGFDPVTPSGASKYTIEISPASPSRQESDRLSFIYFDFDTYDYIANADLSVDGQSLDRDLIFLVDYSYSGPYTTPARYAAACTALVLLLAALTFLLITEKRPGKKFFSSLFESKLLQ